VLLVSFNTGFCILCRGHFIKYAHAREIRRAVMKVRRGIMRDRRAVMRTRSNKSNET
jgi:hypothetical protein